MKTLLFAGLALLVVAAPVLVLAFAPAPDAGSRPVEYKTYNGYAESKDSGLKGGDSFLALATKADFSRVFDPVLTPRGAPDPVAKTAFDNRLFVAVIKRDEVLWDYKVERVTANGDTLTVSYRATPHKGGGSPRGETAKTSSTARAATAKDDPRPARAETQKDTELRKETARAVPATAKAYAGDTKKRDSTEKAARNSSGTFDSSLILSVPKDKYVAVVFVENGRKVGTARPGN